MFRYRILAATLLGILLPSAPLLAFPCPILNGKASTLSNESDNTHLIIFGTLSNAKRDPNEADKGTTDLTIEAVVKGKEFLRGQKVITLPRYVPLDPKTPAKHLIFIDVYVDGIEPVRGEEFKPNSKVAEYLKGALEVRGTNNTTRLQYFFDYLDSKEAPIAEDAFSEISELDYKDVQAAYRQLPAGKVAKWLQDPKTLRSRLGIYGLIIGHCGIAGEHAPLLRKMLDKQKKQPTGSLEGLLEGYVMLDPKAGWKYVRELLKDDKQEFNARYQALKAARFFYNSRRDIIPAGDVISAMTLLLKQGDAADLAIDDFRHWKRWELTKEIISLYGKESHNVPIVKRAITRFALCAPSDNQAASGFVKARRAENPQWVSHIEELLEEEKNLAKTKSKIKETK